MTEKRNLPMGVLYIMCSGTSCEFAASGREIAVNQRSDQQSFIQLSDQMFYTSVNPAGYSTAREQRYQMELNLYQMGSVVKRCRVDNVNVNQSVLQVKLKGMTQIWPRYRSNLMVSLVFSIAHCWKSLLLCGCKWKLEANVDSLRFRGQWHYKPGQSMTFQI